jgi:hypothetical protein
MYLAYDAHALARHTDFDAGQRTTAVPMKIEAVLR